MNNDLISRSELKKAIEELEITEEIVDFDCDDVSTTGVSQYLDRPDVLDLIDNAETIIPFVSVETQTMIEYERPQGEWKSEGYFVFCDYCGSSNGNNKTPFCPYCGAEMKEGEDHAVD